MASWPLQDAKARLSEVVNAAKRDGPQIITRRGVEEAVVVPIDQWKELTRSVKPTLLEVLQSGPQFDLNIPPRGLVRMRKAVRF
ncbi:type II toxin-antitoxin system Phd/YefM family antitoxin [Granulicella arctica]|uniref:type II toxin-antitoxin system Phd/YefM family antitoxin n=1 Tax=Granulicella arctica TaxID=940613 RepID=UPI0021E00EE2|nr:type II toxin-antitoxin system Phd/YefM family antitoxin [Granulicella arctica]